MVPSSIGADFLKAGMVIAGLALVIGYQDELRAAGRQVAASVSAFAGSLRRPMRLFAVCKAPSQTRLIRARPPAYLLKPPAAPSRSHSQAHPKPNLVIPPRPRAAIFPRPAPPFSTGLNIFGFSQLAFPSPACAYSLFSCT